MKSNFFIVGAILSGICSVGCGDAITQCATFGGMLGYTALALGLMGLGIVLAALGVAADMDAEQEERLKYAHRKSQRRQDDGRS